MVARGHLGFVGQLLLLVDDEEPQLRHGREHGAPRPDDDVHEPVPYPAPLVEALGLSERAVQDGDRVPEMEAEGRDELRSQSYLGDEGYRPAALLDGAGDEADIDGGLAGAGHAAKQRGARLPVHEGGYALVGAALVLRQLVHGAGRALGIGGPAVGGYLHELDEPLSFKALEALARGAGEVCEFLRRGLAELGEKPEQLGLRRGLFRLLLSLRERLLGRDGEPGELRRPVAGKAPHARREHGAHGLVERAEEAGFHPLGELEEALLNERLPVLDGADLLEALRLTLSDGEDEALGLPVAARERDFYAHSGLRPRLESGGNGIVVELVDGEGRGIYGDRSDKGHGGLHVLLADGSAVLALGDLVDGHGDGLLIEGLAALLGLLGDLAGALGDGVDEQVAAVDLFEQGAHGGIKHHF